ncbi:hypothetical protein [Streptomyces sp. LN499]|uniref:hypothetical protein n=1 Tax=Streptomyces sp. LN499 TaxID=3112977 RepID=UPI0037122A5E
MQDEPFVAVALHADHVSGLPAGLELVAPFHVHALEVVLWPLVHGQWLRGQRQEAFVNFLTTWDETIPQFERRVLDTEEIERIDNAGAWDDAHNAVLEALEEYYRRPLQQAAERVQMLGPEAVEQAVNAMLDTVTNMAEGILLQDLPARQDNLRTYWNALGEVEAKRAVFLAASRDALRQTPDTARS